MKRKELLDRLNPPECGNVRFKKTNNRDESIFVIDGHTITRYIRSGTRGEWMYSFSCSCGWLSHNMVVYPERYRTNRIALRHIRTILLDGIEREQIQKKKGASEQ